MNGQDPATLFSGRHFYDQQAGFFTAGQSPVDWREYGELEVLQVFISGKNDCILSGREPGSHWSSTIELKANSAMVYQPIFNIPATGKFP